MLLQALCSIWNILYTHCKTKENQSCAWNRIIKPIFLPTFLNSITLLNTSFLNFPKNTIETSQTVLHGTNLTFDLCPTHFRQRSVLSNRAFLSEQVLPRTLVILSSLTPVLLPPGIPTTHQHETQVDGVGENKKTLHMQHLWARRRHEKKKNLVNKKEQP